LPNIGSVCSGGRYDNLAGLFTKQELPGVGASLGLDRLLAAMDELGLMGKVRTPAPIFIAFFDATRLADYLRIAAAIRAAGIGVEVYPEPKKLGQQLKYADSRGHSLALIAGDREFAENVVQMKNLKTGESQTVSLSDGPATLVEQIRRALTT
jgi:histidyl-tRNA synthetase